MNVGLELVLFGDDKMQNELSDDAKKAVSAMEERARQLNLDLCFCVVDGTNNIIQCLDLVRVYLEISV